MKSKEQSEYERNFMYNILGNAGCLNNMFSGIARADYKILCELEDGGKMYEHKVKQELVRDFCHKVAQHLPIKIGTEPMSKTYKMFGFVLSEDDIINLIFLAYQEGMKRVNSIMSTWNESKAAL